MTCSFRVRLNRSTTPLSGTAKVLYGRVYCARGKMENMIKEHKLYAAWMSPRTSTSNLSENPPRKSAVNPATTTRLAQIRAPS